MTQYATQLTELSTKHRGPAMWGANMWVSKILFMELLKVGSYAVDDILLSRFCIESNVATMDSKLIMADRILNHFVRFIFSNYCLTSILHLNSKWQILTLHIWGHINWRYCEAPPCISYYHQRRQWMQSQVQNMVYSGPNKAPTAWLWMLY